MMELKIFRPHLLLALFLAIGLTVLPGMTRAQSTGSAPTEVFGIAADGTVLHWMVYTPATPGPWPAVLVIHGGLFYGGTPDSSGESVTSAQDLAAAGYIAFSIEYRLAPPGALRGQRSAGYFPDQNNDVKLAIRAARADSRCNGQVGAIGGSSGGYNVAYAAVTGTPGDDRIDVGVSLSGVYDLSDFSPNLGLEAFTETVTNFVNVPASDITTLRAASPAWLADRTAAPLFFANSIEDSMPYSQLADLIQHFDALGVTNYQVASYAGSNHSFANWPSAKQQALAFFAAGFAGTTLPPPVPFPSSGDLSKKLLNVSTRSNVGTGDNVMVGGFIVTGEGDKRVVLRALGPSLGQVGINGLLADPVLALYNSAGMLMASNDDRLALPGEPNPLLPANPAESLLTAILPEGSYTAVLQGVNGTSGVGLFELYDLEPGSSRVANISTRGQLAASGDVLIGGFIIGGSDPTKVIARALGPSLGSFGVSSPLPNPVLEMHDSNGTLLYFNDDWRSTQQQEIINSTIPPISDKEAAIVATLPPGNYTAVVRDGTGATGVSLVEVYDLEPQ
ncbi:MAG: alpha/beta hydrolase [Verrucomicrobiota bacterium]|nr:alpha/beta hydrolase [Verrucomicrobiota bacterium]